MKKSIAITTALLSGCSSDLKPEGLIPEIDLQGGKQ